MGRALLVLETPQDRQKAVTWIGKAPVGTRVEFKASKRSLPQNDRLWAMLTDVQAHMKAKGVDYSTDQWKVIFLHAWGKEIEFLPGLDGKTFVPYGQSSSDLSKEEMTDFIEFIIAWGAENGVAFHDPNNPPSAEVPPSSADDDGESPPEASASPSARADTPVPSAGATNSDSALSDEDRQKLIKCYAQLLTIPDTAGISVKTKRDILEGAKDDWKLELPTRLHRHLQSIVLSIDGIIKGHDKMKAANEYAGFLSCRTEELMGGGNG